jgi:hypothetical protein
MRIAIAHLSDIHFRAGANPVLSRAAQIAAAVNSVDPTPSLIAIVISGDVAFSGDAAEYSQAARFFADLNVRLREVNGTAEIVYACVPGNHDCVLPREGTKLRATLVQGIAPAMQEAQQDAALLASLLEAQKPYSEFRETLMGDSNWDGVCQIVRIEHRGHKIQLNLYNTSILSRREEKQGELLVPIKTLNQRISLGPEVDLCVAVSHHSYLWLESNNAVAFRNHIERTCDVSLSGHQHYRHDFYKQNSTGERVLYLEGGALQEETFPQTSAFQVLLFDLQKQEEACVAFRWSASAGHYKRGETDADWHPIAHNRAIRAAFQLNEHFESYLSDPGTPLHHKHRGNLRLNDILVFPDLMIRPSGAKAKMREVRGDDLLKYVLNSHRAVFQAPGLGGKTCLAKALFSSLLSTTDIVPILFSGEDVKSSDERKVVNSFWKAFRDQYDPSMLERFEQLRKEERTLLIDDWDHSGLSTEGRTAFLDLCSQYFGKIFLFADDLFQIRELVDKSPKTTLEFDHANMLPLRQRQRGAMIDRWVVMGREDTLDEKARTREIEEKESLVRSLIGRNTLPSLPFVILCILEAEQEGKASSAEAGSLGYLYEVLVTTALNSGAGPARQLDKKYTYLARLAYRMYKANTNRLSERDVKDTARRYSESHLVNVDVDGMLNDLTSARVLQKTGDSYSFAYDHLFHYFVARYYKDNLDRESGPALRQEIALMTDRISSDSCSTILMFVIYFARDSSGVIAKLVENANQIYAREAPAELGAEVGFLNQFCDEPQILLPEAVDTNETRQERREFQDRIERDGQAIVGRGTREFKYSEDLSDTDKLDLAYRHIEVLGQVIRNFPGSLPGQDKIAILRATYLLGLRLMNVVTGLLRGSVEVYREALSKAIKEDKHTAEEFRVLLDALMIIIARMCVLSLLKRISGSVGVADLMDAYRETLQQVGENNATRLIDLSIRLDKLVDFPESTVRELHKELVGNPFAGTILGDLVVSHILTFGLDRATRQSMAALFKVAPNAPLLIDPSRKRL